MRDMRELINKGCRDPFFLCLYDVMKSELSVDTILKIDNQFLTRFRVMDQSIFEISLKTMRHKF